MALATRTYTAADLLAMPDDGWRYELIQGELRRMAPASYEHGEIAMEIAWSMLQHVKAHNLGKLYAAETGFLIASNPDTVRAPDLAFVRRDRLPARRARRGYWPGHPDLAVEVISPDDSYTAVQEKVFEWLDAGTAMVVVVDPRKSTVTVSRTDIRVLTEDDTLDGGAVLPGWTMPVRAIFAP